MRTMKVLQVIDSLRRGGGAEQLLCHLAPALQSLGISLEIATLWEENDLAPELEARGIPVHSLDRSYEKRFHIPQALYGLGRVVRGVQPDLLHAHLLFSGVYSAMLPRFVFSGPRVVSLHNLDYDLFPAKTTPAQIKKQLQGLLYRSRIDRFVGVSVAVKKHFEEELGLENVVSIPNAIPTDRIEVSKKTKASLREAFGLPIDRPLIVVGGRLVRQKAHELLLEALARVSSPGKRPLLCLAGQGPRREELEEQARALDLDVQFLGVLPHEKLMRLFEAADVVALPSRVEGFGIVVAEAMALGCLVVASDIAPIQEFVTDGETGILFSSGNVLDLVRALEKALASPELRDTLGARAKQHIEKHFSTPVVAERWAEYYRATLAACAPKAVARRNRFLGV